MQALISFQTVTAVPVAAAFDEGICAVDGAFDEVAVVEEEAEADDGEDEVDFCGKDGGLLEDGFECF